MVKLFMFYLGGSVPGANIEVHDVQFAIGETVADTYPTLRRRWFGDPRSLHLDAYAILTSADGHDIRVGNDKPSHSERLYFVNMGAYSPNEFQELHEFSLFVSRSAAEARARAKASLLKQGKQRHKDNLMQVDDCLLLDHVDGAYLHLEPNARVSVLRADWQGYEPIA